ncbi:NADPH-dependent FMN reductase [Streptomyces sp. TS71-3]|uniref:NADPH-dependent FMN reductase n=1 Tax=Streptomyces sp. TS71-3 TaxID=2733862 RepID=UPI001B130028|nr:NAD(P)H-dependent oxidoreductase [Streptomyces sp. TS71-3]GHJ37051.1 oxidoreductase [Streptomyces sp. TS71-3]
MTRIVLISGSMRGQSVNTAAIATLRRILTGGPDPVETRVLLPSRIPFYDQDADAEDRIDAAARGARRLVESADAVVISTPSYNGLISGLLMNALDWLSRPWHQGAIAGKPVAMLSASPGARGAVDAQPVLRSVLLRADAVMIDAPTVAIRYAEDLPRADGHFTDPGVIADLTELARAVLDHLGRSPCTGGLDGRLLSAQHT